MRDTQLCSQILGIAKRRKVIGVPVSLADDEVEVTVATGRPVGLPPMRQAVPQAGQAHRGWRHLGTDQLRTVLVARAVGAVSMP